MMAMRRRPLLLAAPLLALLWIMRTFYIHQHQLSQLSSPSFPFLHHGDGDEAPKRPAIQKPVPPAPAPVKDGKVLPAKNITTYLDAIFGRGQTDLPTFECPTIDGKRYKPLLKGKRARGSEIRWFFALNLRECVELLPRLIGSIVEVMRFLDPQDCALSIVEGQSPDGTADVLIALEAELQAMGVKVFFHSSTINTKEGNRIGKLAELRNMALEPLYNADRVGADTNVIFLNDVAACPDDILELAFQRQHLGADMTCGMDWNLEGGSLFYDVWIARDISGESFFRIGDDGNWGAARDLFWNSPETKARFEAKRPFHAFACWNGGAVFGATPLIKHKIRFRTNYDSRGECFQGEPQLFCKDLWFHGYQKIAVVPTVNLEYMIEKGRQIKKEKGYVSENVAGQDLDDDKVEWQNAPDLVRCMPTWQTQQLLPWNQSLTHD